MIWTVLAGLLSGALGAMGLGGGGVLVIYLTLAAQIEQTTAQGVNLLLFIPCALLALIPYCRKKLICWKIALPAILFGLAGAFAGKEFLPGKFFWKISGFPIDNCIYTVYTVYR